MRSAEAFALHGPLLELTNVTKDYQGLRPLRIASLKVNAGDQVAVVGLDAVTAEIFVNLVTGAILPDTGIVRLFGRPTSQITDPADWMAMIERFGLVSRRAVLLESLSVVQNIAIPLSLEIEPPPPDVLEQATARAREAGLPDSSFDRPVAELDAAGQFRVRLAKALAPTPAVVVYEHPTAELAPADHAAIAEQCRAVASARHIASVVLTADRDFAKATASQVLSLEPASGWLSRFRRA